MLTLKLQATMTDIATCSSINL